MLIRSRSIVTCGVLGGCSGLYAHWQLEETLLVQVAAAPGTNSAAGEDDSAEEADRPDVLTFSRLCTHVKNSFKVLDLMSATESLYVAKGNFASLPFFNVSSSKHFILCCVAQAASAKCSVLHQHGTGGNRGSVGLVARVQIRLQCQ